MEQISRMAAEVNKLIGLNLLEGGAIYLPEIGSLYTIVDDSGAKRIDFSSSEQGVSLVDVIKDRAECTPEQASEIFRRWLEEVRTTESIIIVDGVGELRQKSFVAVNSFSDQLNTEIKIENSMEENQTPQEAVPTPTPTPAPAPAQPTNEAPEKKKCSKGIIIILLIVIVVALAGFFGYKAISKSKAEKATIEAAAAQRAAEQQRVADSIAVAQIETKRIAEAAAVASTTSPRYRLVYGVYELRSNVDVAIAKINKLYGEGSAHEYPFGAYTLVSMFESNDRSECQRLLMKNYETFPDAWIYDSQR